MANDSFQTPQTTTPDYTSGELDQKHKWTPESINAAAKQMTSMALQGQHGLVNHLVNNPGDLSKFVNSGFKQLPQLQSPTLPAGQGVNPNQPLASQTQQQPLPAGQGYDPNKPLAAQAENAVGNGSTVGSNLYRAMAYGPSQGEYTHDTLNGPLGKLQQGDIAVAPNLLSKYPLGSFVNVVDKDGNVLRSNMRVADYSYVDAQHPNTNAFELWNDQDLGHANLVPVSNPATADPSQQLSSLQNASGD